MGRFSGISTLENRNLHDIMRSVGESVEATKNTELLMVYLAGHAIRGGSGDLLISTSDTELKTPNETAISTKELAERFKDCRGKVLFVVDSILPGPKSESPSLDVFRKMAMPSNVSIIASTRSAAGFQKDLTTTILQGMLGHADENFDGNVDVHEICNYMSNYFSATYRGHSKSSPCSYFLSNPPAYYSSGKSTQD